MYQATGSLPLQWLSACCQRYTLLHWCWLTQMHVRTTASMMMNEADGKSAFEVEGAK